MLLSLNWLKQYVNLPKNLTAKKLAHDLTMSTVEVESIENQAEMFDKIVVGKIVEVKNHPNADKLKLVSVDVGKNAPKGAKKIDVVCGGINLCEGMLVAVALPGSKVRWHGEGDLVELQETEIRGQKSFGMICSSNEIGLESMFSCGEKEILDLGIVVQDRALNQHLKPGQNLAEALGLDDTIIELDNKSITHRPDLWNHYGVARELAVIYKTPLEKFQITNNKFQINSKLQNSKFKNNNLSIKIQDKKLCPRYIGCLIKNVKVGPSPEWLVKSLEAVGLRSTNNIVDITNYVMLDVGEPMHAFDKAKLYQTQIRNQKSLPRRQAGEIRKNEKIEINIRTAKNGEKIKTFNGVERKLDENILVIADSEKPIALAGVMGGLDSSVDDKTTEIILEAANFDAFNVRKTTQKLNIRTEASNRFEKKLAGEFAILGMQKALQLIKEIIPEAEMGSMVDINYAKNPDIKIKIEHEFIEKRIGQEISSKEIKNILERLGFVVETQDIASQNTGYKITVPYWRSTGDIDCPEDIVEEVARIYGYNNLKDQPLGVKLHKQILQPEFELCQKIKDFLVLNSGLNEIFNYPWTEEIYLKKLGENGKMIIVANPPSEANKWLQNSLIPNLVKNIEDNLRYFDEFGIFEMANVYLPSNQESKMLAIGFVSPKNTDAFLSVKGIIENIFNILQITDYRLQITKTSESYLNSEKSLAVCVGDKQLGWLGELKKEIYQKFNFKNRNICLTEINLTELIAVAKNVSVKKYQPLPQFPSVVRDLAFELGWSVNWESVNKEILKLVQDDNIKKETEFLSEFDLGNKKSLAFRIIYQAHRTLTDKEVDNIQEKIIKLITEKFAGKLRVNLKK
ncbi:MAG TPA: phenylalanine--tRNA ligase subunit beta [bacterium]|nr:phenylalanine--tRNA ligase subunit beta [bacterium]